MGRIDDVGGMTGSGGVPEEADEPQFHADREAPVVALNGSSPSWYWSEVYRARVVREPREVLRECGLELGPSARITVWDAAAESRYTVLPQRPAGTDDPDETALAALVTRRGLIGTALV